LSEFTLEFTGERVVPGLVDPNLFNEHVARYRFAAAFCGGADVLDAGCGTGYGTAQLQGARSITAFDIAADAVAYARQNFSRPDVRFLRAACETIPFANASFDLMVAYELIEHLERWPELIAEARRVLRPGGVLLISTPNRKYYAEARAEAGPNPFHAHEFDFDEFDSALKQVFPHVRMWTQNHNEAIVFAPPGPANGTVSSDGDPDRDNANFFLAACSTAPLAEPQAFAWLPSGGNLLRERERHIELLAGEIQRKDMWLQESKDALATLNQAHDALLTELQTSNTWAGELNCRLEESGARIAALNTELQQRLEWVRDQESQVARAHSEIARLNNEIVQLNNHVARLNLEIEALHSRFAATTANYEAQLAAARDHRARLESMLEDIRRSRWVRLGRKINVGPEIIIPVTNGGQG